MTPPPAGSVTLRSTIMHRGVQEKANMARVLEHIGMHYVPTVQVLPRSETFFCQRSGPMFFGVEL